MDVFLFEKWKIVYRTALTILKLLENAILGSNCFEDILKELKNLEFLNNIEEDYFMTIATT